MKVRAELATNPSPGLTYYRGFVEVFVADDVHSDADILSAAVRQLQRTSFPDRGFSCWRLIGWETAK